VLERFDTADDLEYNPLNDWDGTSKLPWDTALSIEETERNVIGVLSTSPGTDKITVRLLRACWTHIKSVIHNLYAQCLAQSHFPSSWKLAEVVMLLKVGKKDRSLPRLWQPIALLFCISKGLERIIARRIAWTALRNKVLSRQHRGALPKRSAMDLVALFTYDIKAALANGKEVTMFTLDVQGAFDAVLKRQLLRHMTE
jgi:hypothetical protein